MKDIRVLSGQLSVPHERDVIREVQHNNTGLTNSLFNSSRTMCQNILADNHYSYAAFGLQRIIFCRILTSGRLLVQFN